MSAGSETEPVLSVCIPTYHRPELLRRALGSVVQAQVPAGAVEIVVSDNSTDDRSEELCEELLAGWNGPHRYVRNRPGVGAEPNFNRCRELASGRWIHILHDDDFLTGDGLATMLDAVSAADHDDRVLLFGVHVVDQHERVRRRQEFEQDRRLPPAEALIAVLRHSSFVRFPAIVVRADAYAEAGPFDVELRNPTDFDMWTRLFSRFGVRCIPRVSCAYTVHDGALTEAMFEARSIDVIGTIFDRVAGEGVVAEDVVRRCQADFFHQFILAATYRRLRARDLAGARQTMRLFAHPLVRRLGRSRRWATVRLAFTAVTLAPRRQLAS